MGTGEIYRAGNGKRMKSRNRYGLHIVRTALFPHPEINNLIDTLEEEFGPAFEKDKGEKGVVLLESRAILHAIKDHRGAIDRRILAEAEQRLVREMQENGLGQSPIDVRVNPRRPLKMFGKHKDIIALSLLPDMRLGSDRGAIEIFIDNYYPCDNKCDTDLKQRALPLDAHITLGKIKPQLLERNNLSELGTNAVEYLYGQSEELSPFDKLIQEARPRFAIPAEVSLNGLRVAVESYT